MLPCWGLGGESIEQVKGNTRNEQVRVLANSKVYAQDIRAKTEPRSTKKGEVLAQGCPISFRIASSQMLPSRKMLHHSL